VVSCHSSSFAAPAPSAFLAFLLLFFFFFSPVEGGAAAGSLPESRETSPILHPVWPAGAA
jgi:hypothetical protein